ncbi:hypothetical protein B0H10DRAFT_1356011 [Mycena sp. CBHHK59/15]|nr:hypothetical protein B0H10DRAFT_1356011 [Mycena sp. CBHHK59/15]
MVIQEKKTDLAYRGAEDFCFFLPDACEGPSPLRTKSAAYSGEKPRSSLHQTDAPSLNASCESSTSPSRTARWRRLPPRESLSSGPSRGEHQVACIAEERREDDRIRVCLLEALPEARGSWGQTGGPLYFSPSSSRRRIRVVWMKSMACLAMPCGRYRQWASKLPSAVHFGMIRGSYECSCPRRNAAWILPSSERPFIFPPNGRARKTTYYLGSIFQETCLPSTQPPRNHHTHGRAPQNKRLVREASAPRPPPHDTPFCGPSKRSFGSCRYNTWSKRKSDM